MITVKVEKFEAWCEKEETLTSGTVGLKIKVNFSPDWDALTAHVVFSNGETELNAIPDENGIVEIPWEVMEKPKHNLIMGAIGLNDDGSVVIPTVYANLGQIQVGTKDTTEMGKEATPNLVGQIQNIAQNAENIAQGVRDDADAGKFDGADGKPPIVGDNGNWFIWSEAQGDYVDSGEPARGPEGPPGEVSKEYVDNTFAPAIRDTLSGTVIAVNDVSPVEHDVECNIESINMLDPEKLYAASSKNLTYGKKAQGKRPILFKKGITYTASSVEIVDNILLKKQDETILVSKYGVKQISYTAVENMEVYAQFYNSAEHSDINVNTIMLNVGKTALPYTPYVPDLTAVTVSRYGGNLVTEDVVTFEGNTDIYAYKKVGSEFRGLFLPAGTEISIYSEDGRNWPQITISSDEEGMLSFVSAKPSYTVTLKKSMHYSFNLFDNTKDVKTTKIIVKIGTPSRAIGYSKKIDYKPTLAGTVEGMTSLSPDMTILTDTPGVNISATYNKSIEKVLSSIRQEIPYVPEYVDEHNADPSAHEDIRRLIPTVDPELSDTSKNAVQNQAVTKALNSKADKENPYVFITEVTTEGGKDLSITQEPDGTPFNFSAMRVTLEYDKPYSGFGIVGMCDDAWGATAFIIGSDNNMRFVFDVKIVNGKPINFAYNYNSLRFTYCEPWDYINHRDKKSITGFRTNGVAPAGTKITIEAVRN